MAKMPVNQQETRLRFQNDTDPDVYKDKADQDKDPGHQAEIDTSNPQVKAAQQAMNQDSNVTEEAQGEHVNETHGPGVRDATCGEGCRPTS